MKTNINISPMLNCCEQLTWNRFTVIRNARAAFAKAVWSGADRDKALADFVHYAQAKRIDVARTELELLWNQLASELQTNAVQAGGAQ